MRKIFYCLLFIASIFISSSYGFTFLCSGDCEAAKNMLVNSGNATTTMNGNTFEAMFPWYCQWSRMGDPTPGSQCRRVVVYSVLFNQGILFDDWITVDGGCADASALCVKTPTTNSYLDFDYQFPSNGFGYSGEFKIIATLYSGCCDELGTALAVVQRRNIYISP